MDPITLTPEEKARIKNDREVSLLRAQIDMAQDRLYDAQSALERRIHALVNEGRDEKVGLEIEFDGNPFSIDSIIDAAEAWTYDEEPPELLDDRLDDPSQLKSFDDPFTPTRMDR